MSDSDSKCAELARGETNIVPFEVHFGTFWLTDFSFDANLDHLKVSKLVKVYKNVIILRSLAKHTDQLLIVIEALF